MARPTTVKGTKFLLQLGDGASPEQFTAPCALNAKGINFSAETNDFQVGDCDDPDAPVWTERVKRAFSASINGSGTLAMESLATWQEFYEATDSRNVRAKIDSAHANAGYWEGRYHLTTFNINGPQDGLIEIEIELTSDGEVIFVDSTP